MPEERRVRRHPDDVGVAVQAGNEGSFGECALPIVAVVRAGDAYTLRRIFTGKNFRASPWVLVITTGVVAKPLRGHVIVFVNQIGL